jgi:galactokinase
LITSEASARICLFGDHQDYLNLPVIAGTIDRKITLKARPNSESTYNLQLIDLNKVIYISLNEKFNTISLYCNAINGNAIPGLRQNQNCNGIYNVYSPEGFGLLAVEVLEP